MVRRVDGDRGGRAGGAPVASSGAVGSPRFLVALAAPPAPFETLGALVGRDSGFDRAVRLDPAATLRADWQHLALVATLRRFFHP